MTSPITDNLPTIVERLRAYSGYGFSPESRGLCTEAASVITALAEALENVRSYVSDAHNGHALFDGERLSTDMTGEDLARIDAALRQSRSTLT